MTRTTNGGLHLAGRLDHGIQKRETNLPGSPYGAGWVRWACDCGANGQWTPERFAAVQGYWRHLRAQMRAESL